jgi:hypothetical protein
MDKGRVPGEELVALTFSSVPWVVAVEVQMKGEELGGGRESSFYFDMK